MNPHIKPAAALGLKELRVTGVQGAVCVPYAQNVNDKRTLFAGSLFSGAVLAGYRCVQRMMRVANLAGALVCKDASIRYEKPVTTDALCRTVACGRFSKPGNGKRQVRITVEILDRTLARCALARCTYVVIEVKP
jgi:thioesterase domain-containing protein